jgi:hypothetical protein
MFTNMKNQLSEEVNKLVRALKAGILVSKCDTRVWKQELENPRVS